MMTKETEKLPARSGSSRYAVLRFLRSNGFKFWLYIGLLHLGLFGLSYGLLSDKLLWLFPVELGLLASLYLAYRLFRTYQAPAKRLQEALSTLQSQEFQQFFRPSRSPELNPLLSLYNEMIQQIRQERQEIQEQHFYLEKLIDASPSGILLLDYDDHLTYVNPSAMRLLQLQDNWHQRALQDLAHPLLRELSQIPMGESRVISLHGLAQYKCHAAQFIHRGFQRKFLLIEELSQELLAHEKLAYGKVIRMMAHEVNNSIGAINSILHSLSEMEVEELIDNRAVLAIAIDRNQRLNQFMRNFADVIRLPEPHPETVAIHAQIRHTTTLMRSQAEKIGINLELDLPEPDFSVPLDLSQFEQVLVNLLKNAFESIGQNGIVRISTQAQPPTLIIADNGPGISQALESQLFTPFFSTKSQGQGVGLTLVREILSNHGFSFSLQTEADGWTRFRIGFDPA